MLALSRKKNEALVINNNVEITVLEIKGVQIENANKEAGDVDGMEALKNLLG